MTEKSIQRHYEVNQALKDLQKAVPESRIVYEDEDVGAIPFCTVDGKRQVVSITGQPGYDLWTPKRNPLSYQFKGQKIHNDMGCNDFACSLEQAICFLKGAPMHIIRGMETAYSAEQKKAKAGWSALNSVLKEISNAEAFH